MIPVLAFSDIEHPTAMEAIVECGADGYTSKTRCCVPGHMEKAIKQIIDGIGYYDDPAVFDQVKNRMKMEAGTNNKGGINALSAAEMKVLKSLPSDKTPMGQAAEIHMSIHTYNNHLKSISTKLGPKSSKTLMKLAYSLGLIEI